MALDDFDDLTDEAFAYLQEDFGYRATPTKIGGRFNTACVREFVREDLNIVLVVGDADSSHFCSIVFVEKFNAIEGYESHDYHYLSTLLISRQPDFSPPSVSDLPTRDSQVEAIRTYAALLRDCACKEVSGDLSSFSS